MTQFLWCRICRADMHNIRPAEAFNLARIAKFLFFYLGLLNRKILLRSKNISFLALEYWKKKENFDPPRDLSCAPLMKSQCLIRLLRISRYGYIKVSLNRVADSFLKDSHYRLPGHLLQHVVIVVWGELGSGWFSLGIHLDRAGCGFRFTTENIFDEDFLNGFLSNKILPKPFNWAKSMSTCAKH